jgi:MFS family permease
VRKLLTRRDARLFLGGQLVSMFGDWALVLVLGIWAKSLTGSSADAGLVFFAFAVPALLAPLGGYVADRTRALRQIVVGVGLALLVVGFAETLIFTIIQHVLHRPPSFFGVLSSLQGVGAIAGGITAPLLLRRLGDAKLVGLGLVCFAAGDSLFLVHSLAVVLAGFAIAGVGIAWLVVAFGTALQLRTPLPIQARVTTAADVAVSVPQTVSIAAGAALSTVVDYRVLVVAMALVTACCGVWLSTRRTIERAAAPALA